MTQESAQLLSNLGLLVFIAVCILCCLGLFIDVGRKAVRWVVIFGLAGGFILALVSGRLYYWHHFERLFQ